MEQQKIEELKFSLSDFLDRTCPKSDFSQVNELEDFRSICINLSREEDVIRLCQRALEVFNALPRPILLSDLFSWSSCFSFDSKVSHKAGKELLEVLPRELSKVNDAEKILKWRYDINTTNPFSNKIRELLETRLSELLSTVSLENIPKWFDTMLVNSSFTIMMPDIFLKAFIRKVEELEAVL